MKKLRQKSGYCLLLIILMLFSLCACTQVPDTGKPDNTVVDDVIVLTISGNAAKEETSWTLSELKSLADGYREIVYSTTNNWPSYGKLEGNGISLQYLLAQVGILDTAASFRFTSADGYFYNLTYQQVYGERYSYEKHSVEESLNPFVVEPILAWEWGEEGRAFPQNLRLMLGQIGSYEVNTLAFVKSLYKIEVSNEYLGRWAAPTGDIASGTTVDKGTKIDILHENRDSIRIYYTIDGSDPDYSSAVYNPSTSYYQPQLIVPIEVNADITIKAFAAGIGKDDSPIATFVYKVK